MGAVHEPGRRRGSVTGSDGGTGYRLEQPPVQEGQGLRKMSLWRITVYGVCLFVLVIGLAVLSTPSPAHNAPTGWAFDTWCCNGNGVTGDCQRIPASSVNPAVGGYRITLRPGDHGMVTRPHVFDWPQSKVRLAPDGFYYACLYPTENTLRCFYAPTMGF